MSFIADVSIDMPLGAPTHEAVPDATGTLADYHHIEDESGAHRYVLFLWMTGCEFGDLERAMAADETVESFEAIADSGERRLYRIRSAPFPEEEFLLSVFLRDHDVALHEARRDREGLHLRAQFPSRETLQAMRRAVRDVDWWFRLNGVYSEDAANVGGRELTDRQREVLSVAASRGYFETPSEASLSEIADDLDVSPQAISKHLRAAVRKLVDGALEADAAGARGDA